MLPNEFVIHLKICAIEKALNDSVLFVNESRVMGSCLLWLIHTEHALLVGEYK